MSSWHQFLVKCHSILSRLLFTCFLFLFKQPLLNRIQKKVHECLKEMVTNDIKMGWIFASRAIQNSEKSPRMFTDLRSWALAHLCPSLLLTARLEFKSVCDGNESMIKMRIFQDSLWAPWPFLYKYGIHTSQASCGKQNWFQLFWIIFSTNWGVWGTFTLFGLGGKFSFNFALNYWEVQETAWGLDEASFSCILLEIHNPSSAIWDI